MKLIKSKLGRILSLFLIVLTLLLATLLTSCNGGTDVIHTKEELTATVSGDSYTGYDYVWKYLDRWDFPTFNSTKIRNAEYLVKRYYYKDLPDSRDLADLTASAFLEEYYDTVDLGSTEAVTDALLACYVKALGDKWAVYRTPEQYDNYNASGDGMMVGIGVKIIDDDSVRGLQIAGLISGSPAEASGLLAGDVIVAIDDTRIEDMDFDSAADLISGEVGTKVKITVLRSGTEISFDVMRAMIDETTVSYVIDGDVGYIRISGFKLNTDEQFKEAVDHMKKNGINKVIYDLRANLGGYLSTVIEMLDYIAPKGVTLATFSDGTAPAVDETDDPYLPTAVILTDYNTASAAELFTGAVLDLSDMGYGKAISVGDTTRGKGVMQSTFSLGDGSSITFTSAYYNSPTGQNFHEKGIEPDVRVLLDGVTDTQLAAALTELEKLANQN